MGHGALPDPGESEFGGSDDPMASIRPPLPETPRAQTVELASLETGRATHGAEFATHQRWEVIPVRGPESEESDESAYTLISLLGEGGMGEVWQARQGSLGRVVALKRLRQGVDAPAGLIRQFESEARLTGVLDHPNIVTVHELGRDQDGRVFYTMKQGLGTPWADLIAAGSRVDRDGARVELGLRDHLEILLEVANAIAFAHSRGVIHRDIKPGNVMVGDFGEVLVVDWGLAVALGPIESLSGAETWSLAELPSNALTCGTPAYMSPETAHAIRNLIGPATDVYLLGAVLFHVVYGHPPHRGRSLADVIQAARRNAWTLPEPPAKRRAWHALLSPILFRSLATDTRDRYSNGGEFVEALRTALHNYDSAKLASTAADALARLDLSEASAVVGYDELAKIVARFEQALQDWPGNFIAHRGLASAHVAAATFALQHGDIGFSEAHLDAFEALSDATLGGGVLPEDGSLDAERRVRSRSAGDALESGGLGSSGDRGPDPAIVASIDPTADQHVDRKQWNHAVRLRRDLQERTRASGRRRRATRGLQAAAIALFTGLVVTFVGVSTLTARERDRTTVERNQLVVVLLDETAARTEAQLDGLFGPVHGTLVSTSGWASAGLLDSDDPQTLNRLFMPMLASLPAASSFGRADRAGREYSLRRTETGWQTRSTAEVGPTVLQHWDLEGRLTSTEESEVVEPPRTRPRNPADQQTPAQVDWAPAGWLGADLGMSVTTVATSPAGRDFVLAFDVDLRAISSLTEQLPRGIDRGEVFVLDGQDRLLGLPREAMEEPDRHALILQPIAELGDRLPKCHRAFMTWQIDRSPAPFRFQFDEAGYWVAFRPTADANRPKLWIGVVVPESDFADPSSE